MIEAMDKVQNLVNEFTGYPTGDGELVTDIYVGYAEPGYSHNEDTIVVLGNWNAKRYPREGDAPLTEEENKGPILAEKLDAIEDVEVEWLDEWTGCDECWRAMRTQADSYSWQMYGAWIDDVGYICADCLRKEPTSVEQYVNNPQTAITWGAPLEEWGWVQWEPDNPVVYANGWHEGQNDDPKAIFEHLSSFYDEVVFVIDGVGQFDVHFTVWGKGEISEGVV